MAIAIFTILFFAGLVMLAVGARGKRINDHPLCRRCGFDLSHRSPGSNRCPECGTDVASPNAIRVGHRARSTSLLAVSLIVLIPAALGLASVVYYRVYGFDFTR